MDPRSRRLVTLAVLIGLVGLLIVLALVALGTVCMVWGPFFAHARIWSHLVAIPSRR